MPALRSREDMRRTLVGLAKNFPAALNSFSIESAISYVKYNLQNEQTKTLKPIDNLIVAHLNIGMAFAQRLTL